MRKERGSGVWKLPSKPPTRTRGVNPERTRNKNWTQSVQAESKMNSKSIRTIKSNVTWSTYHGWDEWLWYKHLLDSNTCNVGAFDVQPFPNASDRRPYYIAVFTHLLLAPKSISFTSKPTNLGLGDQASWTWALSEKFDWRKKCSGSENSVVTQHLIGWPLLFRVIRWICKKARKYSAKDAIHTFNNYSELVCVHEVVIKQQ